MSGKQEKRKRREGQVISITARRGERAFEQRVDRFLEDRAVVRRTRSNRRRHLFAWGGLIVTVGAALLTIAAILGR